MTARRQTADDSTVFHLDTHDRHLLKRVVALWPHRRPSRTELGAAAQVRVKPSGRLPRPRCGAAR